MFGAASPSSQHRQTIQELVQEGSLKNPQWYDKIPQTIRDALGLVGLLEERYLWVDSLCIIRDDSVQKHGQINVMASIFKNASFTIVAAQDNANCGIPGLPGVSNPRAISQLIFHLDEHRSFVDCPPSRVRHSTWSTRGWTFQESILSKRKLIVCDGMVEWQCL